MFTIRIGSLGSDMVRAEVLRVLSCEDRNFAVSNKVRPKAYDLQLTICNANM